MRWHRQGTSACCSSVFSPSCWRWVGSTGRLGRRPRTQAGPPCGYVAPVRLVLGAELAGERRFLVPTDERRGDHQPRGGVKQEAELAEQQCLADDDDQEP